MPRAPLNLQNHFLPLEKKQKRFSIFLHDEEPLSFKSHSKIDDLVKSRENDGFVKSSRCKARKNLGVKLTYTYAATMKVKRNDADGLFTKPSRI